MIELPLIFVAGFLGSSHCVGMCGPFALLLGSSHQSWKSGLARQLTYSVGRIFTYSIIGAVAGFCGWRLASRTSDLLNVPAVLSIVAGLFLIYQGLATAGVISFFGKTFASKSTSKLTSPCLAGGLLASFLKSPSRWNVFLAGLFTGFLPCGLVYGFVGIAASSRDVFQGAATMAAFGVGTIPIMVATGMGGGLLTLTTRSRLLRIAAWCVVIAGLVSIARGVSFIGIGDVAPQDACPLCP